MLDKSSVLIYKARCDDGVHLCDVGLHEYPSSRATRTVDDATRFLLVSIDRQADDDDVCKTLTRWVREGVKMKSARYRFLGYTEAQLKEGKIMFFREDHVWTVKRLLDSFGNLENVFHMSGYGKYSALLGLSFSSTIESLEVLDREVIQIPDFAALDGSLHTDGCGMIRDSFAKEVCAVHGFPSDTTVFQVSRGGIKGILVRYPDEKFERICGRRSSRAKVAFRPSMLKYTGGATVLEINDHNMSSAIAPARLNFQLIAHLLIRRVPCEVFERMMQDQLDAISSISTDRGKALQYIRGELDAGAEDELNKSLYAILLAQHSLDEPYVRQKLELFQRTQYDRLRKKLDLRVPDSCYLYGVVDEDGILGPNEVYINLPSRGGVIVRYIMVGRDPTYYPGDLRTFSAVAHPALRHHRNCIVFPRTAAYSIPASLAPGDLGGDKYFVSWDPALLPKADLPPLARSPSLSAPHRRQSSGRQNSDMPQEAVDTFIELKFNRLLDQMTNDWVRQVEKTPDLAMGEIPLRLVPLMESALDCPKTGDDLSRLEYEFRTLRLRQRANLRPGTYVSPIQALRDMVPQNTEPAQGHLICDRSLIIEDEDLLLWQESVAEAERVMRRYNKELRHAHKLDCENAERDDLHTTRPAWQVRERTHTEQVECEYRDRYFGGGSRKEFERQRMRASAWYCYGYSKGNAAFAWLGQSFLNEIRAVSSNGYKPVIYIGARDWRPEKSCTSSLRGASEATLVEQTHHPYEPAAHSRRYDNVEAEITTSDEDDFSDVDKSIPPRKRLPTPNDCRAPRRRDIKLETTDDDPRARTRTRCKSDNVEWERVSIITHPKPKEPVAQRYDIDCRGRPNHDWRVQANGTWRRYFCYACGSRVEEKKGADGYWETACVVASETASEGTCPQCCSPLTPRSRPRHELLRTPRIQ